jgi:hypothetical protein
VTRTQSRVKSCDPGDVLADSGLMLAYAGVFALIALTATVAVGLVALALRLVPAGPAPARRGALARKLSLARDPVADTVPDLAVSEEWIAEIADITGEAASGRRPLRRRR